MFLVITMMEGLLMRLVMLLVISVWAGLLYVSNTHDERLFMIPFVQIHNLWIRKVRKGYLWNSEKSRRPIMKLQVVSFGELGLIHNKPKDTDSMIIEAIGSHTVALPLRGQYAVHAAIADIYRRAAAIQRGIVEIQSMNRARPEDGWTLWNMLSAEGEPEVLLPVATQKKKEDYTDFDKRMLFLNSVAYAMPEIYAMSNLATMVFVITVKRSRAFSEGAKKQKMTERTRDSQTLSRIRKVVVTTLQAQKFEGIRVFDAAECERYLRQSWDVVGLHDYYTRAHERLATGQAATKDQWYPERYIRVGRDYIEIDGTFGAVIKLTAGPSGVLPHESRAFFASHSRWYANTVISEAASGSLEYTLTHFGSGFLGDLIGILGIEWSGPKVHRKEEEVRDRMRELDESSYKQDLHPLASVSAESKEALEDAVTAEFDRLTGLGRGPVRVTGETQVYSYYMTAVTGIDHTN
jgi:hypothetical protein